MSEKQFFDLIKQLREEHEEEKRRDRYEYEFRVQTLRERFKEENE